MKLHLNRESQLDALVERLERENDALRKEVKEQSYLKDEQSYLKEKYIKRWDISQGKLERLQKEINTLNAAIDHFRDAAKKVVNL